MTFVKTKNELIKTLKAKEHSIEINEELSKKVIKIRDIGNLSWAVAFVSLTLAIVTVVISGRTSISTFAMILSASVGILGYSIAISFVSIAIIAGIVTVHNFRSRKEIDITQYKLVLSKK